MTALSRHRPGAPRDPRSEEEPGGRRLSSEGTVWWRSIFPRVWTLGVGIGMMGIWLEWWGHPAPMGLKVVGGVLWAGTSILFFLFGSTLHDVWLEDDRLVVSRGGRRLEIPLQDITGYSESRGQQIKTVKVKLRPGSPLGSGIRFLPPLRLQTPFSDHPVVREIQERKRELAGGRGSPRLPG